MVSLYFFESRTAESSSSSDDSSSAVTSSDEEEEEEVCSKDTTEAELRTPDASRFPKQKNGLKQADEWSFAPASFPTVSGVSSVHPSSLS